MVMQKKKGFPIQNELDFSMVSMINFDQLQLAATAVVNHIHYMLTKYDTS